MSGSVTSTVSSPVETLRKRSNSSYSGIVLSTVRYLMRTEVHTFAFSVAANAILSFFPFMLLLMTLILRVFHSHRMYEVVKQLLEDYLPAGQEFVIRNLEALVHSRHQAQIVSLVILLVTSTGIFPAPRSRPQPHLGIRRQPLLLRKPTHLAGVGILVRRAGSALDCHKRRQ